MKCRTKNRRGRAIQYTGNNVKELEEAFPLLTFRALGSKTQSGDAYYTDFLVRSKSGEDYLLVEDFILETDDGEWSVLPPMEFTEYWEKI